MPSIARQGDSEDMVAGVASAPVSPGTSQPGDIDTHQSNIDHYDRRHSVDHALLSPVRKVLLSSCPVSHDQTILLDSRPRSSHCSGEPGEPTSQARTLPVASVDHSDLTQSPNKISVESSRSNTDLLIRDQTSHSARHNSTQYPVASPTTSTDFQMPQRNASTVMLPSQFQLSPRRSPSRSVDPSFQVK